MSASASSDATPVVETGRRISRNRTFAGLEPWQAEMVEDHLEIVDKIVRGMLRRLPAHIDKHDSSAPMEWPMSRCQMATHLLENGYDIRTVQELLRHKACGHDFGLHARSVSPASGCEVRSMPDNRSDAPILCPDARGDTIVSDADADMAVPRGGKRSRCVPGRLLSPNSTISGNSARGTDAGCSLPAGEGLGGGLFSEGNVNITNCTIAANSAEGGNDYYSGGGRGRGGAIVYAGDGIFNLSNSTISDNRAASGYGSGGPPPSAGGGILNGATSNGAFKVESTIVANNSAELGPDVEGSFASQGFNLIGNNEGSIGFTLATDKKGTVAKPLNPKLGVLQNNGGPTETMALMSSSPAVDKGSSVGLTGSLTTDQRGAGFPRTVNRAPANATGGDGTDIGVFEVQ